MAIYLLQPDGVALSAGAHRRGRAALYGGGAGRPVGGRSGFRVDTPDDVLTVSTTAWSLKPCAAMIDPGASTNQGMYGWATDANVTGTPTPPDATLPRKDIYYIQVNDSSAGDGTSGTPNANVYYVAGTPNSNPQAPALPARSFLIATVTVPQSGGGAPTVALNPARFAAAGGVLPVFSAADRGTIAAPYRGLEIQRLDLTQISPSGIRERWNGTTWDHLGHTEFTTPANAAAPNTAWGMGTYSRDNARTTDSSFVTINATDELRIRDAGLYSITVLVSFAKPIGGISWLSADGAYTTTMGGGLQNFVTTMPNVMLAANQIIKPTLAHGSGPDDVGNVNRTFTSRVRISRIA